MKKLKKIGKVGILAIAVFAALQAVRPTSAYAGTATYWFCQGNCWGYGDEKDACVNQCYSDLIDLSACIL